MEGGLAKSEEDYACSLSAELIQAQPPVTWAAFFGAVANCTNTIIGAGTLAVPKVIGMTGLAGYHVMVAAIFSITCVSLYWLVQVVDRIEGDVARNYEGLANHFLGVKWAGAISIAFFFGGISLTMAYMILIVTSLAPVLAELGLGSEQFMERLVLLGLGLGVILPLTLLQDISKLRFTSSLAILAMLYAAAYATYSGASHVATHGASSSVVLWNDSLEIFNAIAMSISAYSCHIAVIPIYDSLGPGHTPRVMMKVVCASLVLALLFYEMVGLAGYFEFGAEVNSNVLKSIVAREGASAGTVLATLGISIMLIFSVPIIIWPVRSVILWVYKMSQVSDNKGVYEATPANVDEIKKLVEQGPSTVGWIVVTVAIVTLVIGLSAVFPDVKTSLSIVGSLGGAFIVFIYPSAFYLAVVKKSPPSDWGRWDHAPQLLIMVSGILVGGISLYISIAR